MDINNINSGANKALDIAKSQGVPEEETQVQEQEALQEQAQVQEQAQIEESELQETEFEEEMDINEQPNVVSISDYNLSLLNRVVPQKQNPIMQMMQKLMQMMMQLLQMMMGKINDEPPEKPTEQPIFTRIEVNNDMYSIPELN